MWNGDITGMLDFLWLFTFLMWLFEIVNYACGLLYISSGQGCFISILNGGIMAHVYFLVFSVFFKLKIWERHIFEKKNVSGIWEIGKHVS